MFETHLTEPRGRGALARAPHQGAAGGAACGDLVRVAVRVDGDRVAAAGFDASGCAAVRAAGSAVVELVEGAAVLDAARLTPDEVAHALGGLTPGGRHAAELAADALHRALGAAARDGAIRLAPQPGRRLVALSGGVDSCAAARLLLDAGHEVVAVTLELWADRATDGARSCCSPEAVGGARALAHRLGLPHLTLDLRERFRARVVDDYVAGHAAGLTPNPCVRCNGEVRFGALLELAERLGAPRLATGHYARIARDAEGPLLRLAADPAKDQSYVLARLRPELLERLAFPLGELTKPAVRAYARAAGLPVADKRDSQDLCFLAGDGRHAFLRRHGRRPGRRRGELVDRAGRTLGVHDGQEGFTVGQRRGLGLSGGEPLYVLAKDAGRERVVVGPRAALATTRVPLRELALLRPAERIDSVRLRLHAAPVPARLAGGRAPALELAEPAYGVAPGQLACLMSGDRIVGSGTIAARAEAA